MSNHDNAPVSVSIHGQVAEVVLEYAELDGLSNDEIVRRAIGLYALLRPALDGGEAMLARRLVDDHDLPALLRIDYFRSDDIGIDLEERPRLDPAARVRAELCSWPLME